MKIHRLFDILAKIILLVLVGFFLGVWSAQDVWKIAKDQLSLKIQLTGKAFELSGYYQRINGLDFQILKLRSFSEIRRRQLGLQEKIIQRASEVVDGISYDDSVQIGPAKYTAGQITSDSAIRETRCQLLRSDIIADQQLVGTFESQMISLSELVEKLESEFIGLGEEKEIVKAKLSALLSDPNVASEISNFFFLSYRYRLAKAQAVFSERLSGIDQFQETSATYDQVFNWYPPIIPDIYWLEPFIKQEQAKQFVASGLKSLEEGNFDQALSFFSQAIKADGENPEAKKYIASVWISRGISSWRDGKHNDAIWCFNKALEPEGNNSSPLTKKGICLVFLGDYQEALSLFDQVLEKDQNYQEAILAKAHALMLRNGSRVEQRGGGCSSSNVTVRYDWLGAAGLYNWLLTISKNKQVIEIALASKKMVQTESESSKISLTFLMTDDSFQHSLIRLKAKPKGEAIVEISQAEIDSSCADFARRRK